MECGGFEARTRELFEEDGYIVKVMGKRKTIFGTAWYQLHHASYKVGVKRFHVATWFGVVSYRKFKFTVEKRKEVCPLCQIGLVKVRYSGSKQFVKDYHSPDFEWESWEDFEEDGCCVWSVMPERQISGSSEDLVGHDY